MKLSIKEINKLMSDAIIEAKEAAWNDEVPIGAVIINKDKQIISRASNLKEQINDVTGHAEIRALKKASEIKNNWRMDECILITTLEPCLMCLNAILQSRIKEVYFGAYDKKGGALSLGYNLHQDKRLNHRFNVYGGFKHYETSQILSKFFKAKRKLHKA